MEPRFVRMKPADRQKQILDAAIVVAERIGFANVRQVDIATEAQCGFGTVSRYFNTMKQMRRAIIREAIQRKSLIIIAAGLGINDPDAQKAPDDLKRKAVSLLAR